jgi:hypothetical protein
MNHKVRIGVISVISLCSILAILVLGCCISGCRKDAKYTSTTPAPETTTPGPSTTETTTATIPGASLASLATLLTWDAPATYTDGSTPLNLKEYRVYFSTSPSPYSTGSYYPISAPATNVKVKDVVSMETGLYYFVVTAVDSSNIESDPSNEVSRYVN